MTASDDPLRLLFVTAPEQDAEALVTTLVSERLIACGNIVPGVRAVYRWKGEVCRETEAALWLETTESSLSAAMDRIVELHPYDTPKVVALAPDAVNRGYLAWAQDNTGGRATDR